MRAVQWSTLSWFGLVGIYNVAAESISSKHCSSHHHNNNNNNNMAPFRRGRSSQPAPPVEDYDDDDDGGGGEEELQRLQQDKDGQDKGRISAWEARRRRKSKPSVVVSSSPATPKARSLSSLKGSGGGGSSTRLGGSSSGTRRGRGRKEPLPDDEYDPYDSDPGESYREHCERIKGEGTKSCLAMPRFLKDLNRLDRSGGRVGNAHRSASASSALMLDPSVSSTSPPSPFQSDLGDVNNGNGSPLFNGHHHGLDLHPGSGGLPASLPRDLARVRYSLRTSIGDGSEVQPSLGGSSSAMMERRELRPNNIHINVSHWSDFGGRGYMEDRYVPVLLRRCRR